MTQRRQAAVRSVASLAQAIGCYKAVRHGCAGTMPDPVSVDVAVAAGQSNSAAPEEAPLAHAAQLAQPPAQTQQHEHDEAAAPSAELVSNLLHSEDLPRPELDAVDKDAAGAAEEDADHALDEDDADGAQQAFRTAALAMMAQLRSAPDCQDGRQQQRILQGALDDAAEGPLRKAVEAVLRSWDRCAHKKAQISWAADTRRALNAQLEAAERVRATRLAWYKSKKLAQTPAQKQAVMKKFTEDVYPRAQAVFHRSSVQYLVLTIDPGATGDAADFTVAASPGMEGVRAAAHTSCCLHRDVASNLPECMHIIDVRDC